MAALERVQLLDVAFQRADRLSGGQQQRVAIARALTQLACLILADEPVAGLDITTAHAVLSLLRSLLGEVENRYSSGGKGVMKEALERC
jgi:phosphonate transport system ATP-binding protein